MHVSAPPFQLARRVRTCLSWLCLGLLQLPVQAEMPKEDVVKAAFLYNFAKFVEWPAPRFADAETPIVIGILGHNRFGTELEKIIVGRRVQGRAIQTKIVAAGDDPSTVHLLFVPAGEEHRVEWAALLAADAAVVTVGESERFTALGGMITFVPAADKMRFTINLEAAERARLKVSAQLLKLAVSVRRKP